MRLCFFVVLCVVIALENSALATDYFLTIGGGYSPAGNQASIERNVLFFQRVLRQKNANSNRQYVLFADGDGAGKDVQVVDRQSVPRANQLMAEFLGRQEDLGLSYRNHAIDDVQGSTSKKNIRGWFREVGTTLQTGDRLLLYVTAHGSGSDNRREPHNTSISLWNREKMTVGELGDLLDDLPTGVAVVTVMVQCHAGGFARLIYRDADPDGGFAAGERAGFFATVHDRAAAGCTPDADEASYVEYSTYFWEALSGRTRMGDAIEPPDYDQDGRVSFDEAHAYTIIRSDTIDLPIKTSGELLGIESGFRDRDHPDLMPRSASYSEILELATPAEHAILEQLSAQLNLTGSSRLEDADRQASSRGRGRGRASSSGSEAEQMRRKIAGSLKSRWPELANVLNPVSIELVTTRSDEFIRAVQGHPDYKRYRELSAAADKEVSPQERRVKFERFVRTAENVIMRANLYKLDNTETIAKYEAIVAAESGSLSP
ncbi:MAG: hypothetical protein HKN47_21060 [Pirellulaceae bacterium]|nr:hypothetical protein [Pirellulaceae bacterium]